MRRFLILGGTGTLGQELSRQLLAIDHQVEIRILSRDELKQKQMRAKFNDYRLKFVLGDIREKSSLLPHMEGVDTVFHVAALKHVDTAEENPEECIRTNILGTMNVADAAVESGVPKVVFSSTDKAVDPINVYGYCKAASERLLLNRNDTQTKTHFSVYRWGNVLGSRGSVIHTFAETLKKEGCVYVTDPEMTRFWIRIQDAVAFMLTKALSTAKPPTVLIPPMKAAGVMEIADAVAKVVGVDLYDIKRFGMRPGEKLHEMIQSIHSPEPVGSKDAERFTQKELAELVAEVLQ